MKKIMLMMSLLSVCILLAGDLYAASYDLKTMTPEVQQAIGSRQERYSEIQNLKSNGAIGETNQGYLGVIQVMGNAQMIVAEENRDRRVVYQTISEQNQLGGQGLALIESIFAEVLAGKANSGEWIQNSSGQWVKK